MSLSSIITTITTSPWFAISGVVGTIIGIILTVYFYNKSKVKKQLNISTSTTLIVNSEKAGFEDIEIFFAGEKSSIVSVTKVIVKNTGNKCIKLDDLPPLGSLCIEIADRFKILKISIKDSKTNNFRIGAYKKDDKESNAIEFDYMNPGEFCELSIFHTSLNNDGVKISGALEDGSISYSNDNPDYYIASSIISIISSILVSNGLFNIELSRRRK